MAFHLVAMHAITGVDPVVARPLVGNRPRPGLVDVVCAVVQGGIFAVSVADATVDEAVVRARLATMSAYKNAHYDPASGVMFLHVDGVPGAFMLTVLGDADCFPPAWMEALVRGMEAVAVVGAAASADLAEAVQPLRSF
jgi:hypothetical protein